ncbi:hypothetical protein [Streptomyces sp. MMG1533]|uniref:hypothetical protein n=1 Tax=Streptomyces sp. MMG1533 TaxID=1415546 RepID=UPI0006AEED81|nr:hypothetical protein [Streptomyces sp. MMG1533]
MGDPAVREDLWLMLNAGAGVTTYRIANALRQLSTGERLRHGLNHGTLTLDRVMRATLRNAPRAENVMGALATQDTMLGGRQIRAGDMLVLSLGGANQDPALGIGAARDAYTTVDNGHAAYGARAHHCPRPAQVTGELITTAAFQRLWECCPHMTPADPDKPLSWGPSFVVRALAALHVAFTATEPGTRRAPVQSAFGGPAWNSPSPSSPPPSPSPSASLSPTSCGSTGLSTASTPTAATSPERDKPSKRSGRSSRWKSLTRWWRGQ